MQQGSQSGTGKPLQTQAGEEGDRQIQDRRAGRARAVTVSGFSQWETMQCGPGGK